MDQCRIKVAGPKGRIPSAASYWPFDSFKQGPRGSAGRNQQPPAASSNPQQSQPAQFQQNSALTTPCSVSASSQTRAVMSCRIMHLTIICHATLVENSSILPPTDWPESHQRWRTIHQAPFLHRWVLGRAPPFNSLSPPPPDRSSACHLRDYYL